MTDSLHEQASLTFEPWTGPAYQECMPPTNDEWAAMANPVLVTSRVAWVLLGKTKPELVDMIDKAEGTEFEGEDFVTAQLKRIEEALDWFASFDLLLEAAEARLLCAAAHAQLRREGVEVVEDGGVRFTSGVSLEGGGA